MSSPEVIINELKSEIQDNGFKQAELKDLLDSSNSVLIRSLEQKINERNEMVKNTHEIAGDKELVSGSRNLVNTGRDDMRKEIEKQMKELSQGTKEMILGLQNVTKQVLDELDSKISKSIAEQREEIENTVFGLLDKASSDIIAKTGASIQQELAKLSPNMKEFTDHERDTAVPKILPPDKTFVMNNEVACRWKEDAHFAMSVMSIVLLAYLIISSER